MRVLIPVEAGKILAALPALAERKKALVEEIFNLTRDCLAALETALERGPEEAPEGLNRLLEERRQIIKKVDELDGKIKDLHQTVARIRRNDQFPAGWPEEQPQWRILEQIRIDTRSLLLKIREMDTSIGEYLNQQKQTLASSFRNLQLSKQGARVYTGQNIQIGGVFVDENK